MIVLNMAMPSVLYESLVRNMSMCLRGLTDGFNSDWWMKLITDDV